MNEDIYKAPEWLFRKANVNKDIIPAYQKEMLTFFRDSLKDSQSDFTNIPSQFKLLGHRDKIIAYCPTLYKELQRLGIADLLWSVGIIVANHAYHYPIHIDSANPARLSVGLNIPVLNCTDTYTVFYDVTRIEYEKLLPDYLVGSELAAGSVLCTEKDAVEIGRCDASIPHWINVARPHQPVCKHTKLRINSSIRFTPEIYKLLANGYFEKNLVTHD